MRKRDDMWASHARRTLNKPLKQLVANNIIWILYGPISKFGGPRYALLEVKDLDGTVMQV